MSGGDMSAETKDPAIKLFGKTIPLPESQIPAKSVEKFDPGCQILDKSELMDACSEMTKTEAEDPRAEETGKVDKSSALEDSKEKDHQTPMQVNEAQVNHKPKEDQAETNGMGQEKVLKKPDKVLPCPRCNSLDTKFCYFNNYNVNQPRHFCKNCQRYWTAGGTMRNVPVGAGRRKNKHLASQYRQIMASSDGAPATSVETQDSANPQVLSCGDSSTSFRSSTGNGTVLKFGPEAPLCESMVTVLHLRDQKRCAEMGSVNCGENGEEPSSSGSSMTASSFRDNELAENVMQKEGAGFPRSYNEIPLPQPLHCYPVPPWVFPCNPSWNSSVTSMAASRCSSELVYVPDSSNPNPVQWCSTPMVAGPGFCPPSIPLQFVPASYWGCMPVWAAGTGNVAFAGSNGCLSLSSSPNNSCSGNGSPTLGKHSRDENLIDEEKSDKGIVVPKTLRIDDPDEASKSSIWATLGIKHGRKEILSKGGIFKSFAKAEDKGHGSDATQVLEANPAALSRSNTFQEST